MDTVVFFQTVAAVFIGGLILAAFLWAAWTSIRMERNGTPRDSLPFRVYIFLTAPLLASGLMVFLLA